MPTEKKIQVALKPWHNGNPFAWTNARESVGLPRRLFHRVRFPTETPALPASAGHWANRAATGRCARPQRNGNRGSAIDSNTPLPRRQKANWSCTPIQSPQFPRRVPSKPLVIVEKTSVEARGDPVNAAQFPRH